MIDVVAAVLVREGAVLLARRALNKRHGGLWEFPGGKVMPGEDFSAALGRELHEELDLTLQWIGDRLASVNDVGSEFVIHFIRAVAIGEPRALEHSAVEWVPLTRIDEYELAPSDRSFAERLSASDLEGIHDHC